MARVGEKRCPHETRLLAKHPAHISGGMFVIILESIYHIPMVNNYLCELEEFLGAARVTSRKSSQKAGLTGLKVENLLIWACKGT